MYAEAGPMRENGELVVFEGADGVGKSTLAHWFANHFKGSGVDCIRDE
jgi:thymidylate kinase